MSEDMTIEVVTFVDDEGNEIEMEIIEEFEHKGEKYAVLAEIDDEEEEGDGEGCSCAHTSDETCDCGCEDSLYIFRVVQGEDGEEFLAIEDDELLDELSVIVEQMFADEPQ